MSSVVSTNARVRAILAAHGQLGVAIDTISDASDLYNIGLTSRASVNVMLALEDEFELEFPDRMLRRDVFGSIEAIQRAVDELASRGDH